MISSELILVTYQLCKASLKLKLSCKRREPSRTRATALKASRGRERMSNASKFINKNAGFDHAPLLFSKPIMN